MWEYSVYVQAQSTGEDSNSMSENEEDMSNHGSILNAVKTEPSDILNDSLEHHRNSFPAALLSLQGNYLASKLKILTLKLVKHFIFDRLCRSSVINLIINIIIFRRE